MSTITANSPSTSPRPTRPRLSVLRGLAAAVVTGVSVAVVVHAVVVFAYFLLNGTKPEVLRDVSQFFTPASVALFAFASIAAALRATRFWFTAVVAGIVTSAAAALLGAVMTLVPAGTSLTQPIADVLVASLAGTNLIYIVAAAVTFPTVGRLAWRSVVEATSSSIRVPRMVALVRPPSTRLADGITTHIERVPVDADKADEQWENYVAALEDHGFRAVEVSPADDLPDSVFVEDTVVVFEGVAVITSPGAESRRAETTGTEEAVRQLGFAVYRIDEPGTLDGGDVLKVGMTVYVGRGGRTNADGIRQLRAIVTPLGYSVVAVPITRVLHLKSAVGALPDGTVVGHPAVVEHPELFTRFLPLPEKHGAAIVVLAPDTVLMAASAVQSIALVESLGYRVVAVDVSEFEKLEGSVTCMSVRVR